MAISKVRIEEGCTACGLCEEICPEVFKVNDVSIVIEGVDFNQYEDKIKERESQWEDKRKTEEDRWKKELLEREKEIERKEKEVEMQKIYLEERELEEKERILREMQEEITDRHEKLSTLKHGIGMDKEEDIKLTANMLEENLADLTETELALLVTPPAKHNEIAISLSKMLVSKGMSGIYITFNRPFEQLIRDFQINNIDPVNVIFIDCVSKMAGRFPGKKENAVFIDNPSSLEEVGMYAEKILARIPSPKFIVFDSISSMMIYNGDQATREFAQYFVNKLRLEKVGGFIMTVEKDDVDRVISIFEPIVDKVIKV